MKLSFTDIISSRCFNTKYSFTGLCLVPQPVIMSKFSELWCFGLMKQWQLQLSMSQFVRRGIENNPASTVWLVQLEEHSVTLC